MNVFRLQNVFDNCVDTPKSAINIDLVIININKYFYNKIIITLYSLFT